jgi:NADPH-dependent 2,4-dienoyl-CoA reductase/sulfur reductase-like enzyme
MSGTACAVGCAINPMAGREFDIGPVVKTEKPKKVVVIGGGPGGMQAAITAAVRGHAVTLLEKNPELGGQLNLASVAPDKHRIKSYQDWLAGEMQRQGVSVTLNREADVNVIDELNPDAVIAATGAVPVSSIPVPGLEHTVQAWDILKGTVTPPSGGRVTIIGGGIVGCEVAEYLLEYVSAITIIEMLPDIANGLETIHKLDLTACLKANNVAVETRASVQAVEAKAVTYRKDGVDKKIPADMIVLAVGQTPSGGQLIRQLKEKEYEVIVIGDAQKPAKIIDATMGGLFAGLNI